LKAKRFRRVYVEITGFCGLSCPFCPPKPRTSSKIPTAQFEQLCSQLTWLTSELSLHLLGDPLSVDDLESYLDIALLHGLNVNITTSGAFIRKHADLIVAHKAIRQINFSLNSYQGFGAKKDFATYIEPILRFCQKSSEKHDRFVNLRLWNGSGNEVDEAFRLQALGSIGEFFSVDIGISGGRVRIAPKVIVDFDDYFEWPDIGGDSVKSGFCLGLSDHFGILSDGSMVPCCLDHAGCIRLGDVFTENIVDILDSTRAVAIVDGFANGKAVEELCQKCSYRARFL